MLIINIARMVSEEIDEKDEMWKCCWVRDVFVIHECVRLWMHYLS